MSWSVSLEWLLLLVYVRILIIYIPLVGLGRTLSDKLLRPLIADPDRAPGELNEASRMAIGYLQGRMENLSHKKSALSSVLDLQMGRLSSLAKQISTELNIEEVWLYH